MVLKQNIIKFFDKRQINPNHWGSFSGSLPEKDQAAIMYSLTFAKGTKNGKQMVQHGTTNGSLQIWSKSVTVESIQTVNLNSIFCYPQTLLPSARDFLQLCFSHVTPLFFTSSLPFSCHSRASVNIYFLLFLPLAPARFIQYFSSLRNATVGHRRHRANGFRGTPSRLDPSRICVLVCVFTCASLCEGIVFSPLSLSLCLSLAGP